MNELENAVYQSSFTDSGYVRLVRGAYRAQMDDPEAGQLIVTLTKFRLIGRLNKKQEGAVAIIRTAAGSSGIFFDLAVVLKTDHGLDNVCSVGLGDRVRIKSMSLDDERIVVQMTVHARYDPPCCPTVDVESTYLFRNDRLELAKTELLQK